MSWFCCFGISDCCHDFCFCYCQDADYFEIHNFNPAKIKSFFSYQRKIVVKVIMYTLRPGSSTSVLSVSDCVVIFFVDTKIMLYLCHWKINHHGREKIGYSKTRETKCQRLGRICQSVDGFRFQADIRH